MYLLAADRNFVFGDCWRGYSEDMSTPKPVEKQKVGGLIFCG